VYERVNEEFLCWTDSECRDQVDTSDNRVGVNETECFSEMFLVEELDARESFCIPSKVEIGILANQQMNRIFIHFGFENGDKWSMQCSPMM
jgi:hypothetical protein